MPDAERQRRSAALAAIAAADPPARWLGGQLASLGSWHRGVRARIVRIKRDLMPNGPGATARRPAQAWLRLACLSGRASAGRAQLAGDRGEQGHDPVGSRHDQVGLGGDLR